MPDSIFNQVADLLSCERCEIFKNTFFIEHLRWLLLIIISSSSREFREETFCKTSFLHITLAQSKQFIDNGIRWYFLIV